MSGVAPGANQRLYFQPNSDQGFLNGINQAVADGCDTISISWGAAESQWAGPSLQAMAAAIQNAAATGVNIWVAAGDNGSGDNAAGNNADFPGSAPYALDCGGTFLPTSGPETVWNDGPTGGATGGGVSKYFSRQAWQPGTGQYRQAPDVAGVAVVPAPAHGTKCARCWQVLEEVGKSAAHPLLCQRCEDWASVRRSWHLCSTPVSRRSWTSPAATMEPFRQGLASTTAPDSDASTAASSSPS